LNPELDDSALDLDHDGLTNLREFQIGTRPDLADTDGDGFSDGLEVDGKLGLLAWWRGEGNAEDAMGQHAGATRNGVNFTNGLFGQAFRFDGIDDYVEVPSTDDLNFGPSDSLTVELWAYRTSPAGVQHIIGKRLGCADMNFQMALDNGAPAFGTYPPNAIFTGIPMPLYKWTHLAATFGAGTYRFYIDGTLVSEVPGRTLGATNTAPLRIGTSGDCAPFGGLLDEIGIYRRALSPQEIRLVFQRGKQISAIGTDPLNPDTDADGIRDGIDQAPLVANQPPKPDALHYGLQFDGQDDFVELGNWFTLQTFTIGLWVNAGFP